MRKEWHIVPESDELSRRNGSAVLTVAKSLQTEARQRGYEAWIIGVGNNKNDLPDIRELMVPTPTYARHRTIRFIDSASKYAIGRALARPHLLPDNGDPTHIYCHNQPWLIRSIRKTYPKARIHLYVHNKILQGIRAAVVRELIRSCDRVICVSDFIRQDLAARAQMAPEETERRIAAILHGVDAHFFETPEGPFDGPQYDVTYAGRMIPEKGVHVLTEALTLIARQRQVSARIIGGRTFVPAELSPYEKKLRSAFNHPNLNMEFTGPLAPSHIPEILNHARLHIVPSVWEEPCGLSVLEGFASRACVVATRVGGIPELARNTELRLVPPNDAPQLASVICRYLDDPSMARRDSKSQRDWVRKRAWGQVYEDLLEIDA